MIKDWMDKQERIEEKNRRIKLAQIEKEQEGQLAFKIKKCISCQPKKKKSEHYATEEYQRMIEERLLKRLLTQKNE